MSNSVLVMFDKYMHDVLVMSKKCVQDTVMKSSHSKGILCSSSGQDRMSNAETDKLVMAIQVIGIVK